MDVGGPPPHTLTHTNTCTNEMRNRAVHVGDRALNRGEAQPSICLCQASSLAGRHRVEPRWKCAAISLSFTHTRSSKSPLGHLQELDSELIVCECKLYFIAVFRSRPQLRDGTPSPLRSQTHNRARRKYRC